MKILLSKVNQLGDNIQFLPVVQALAKHIPHGDLAIQTSRTASDLYRGVLPADCIWAEPTDRLLGSWKSPRYFSRLLRQWADFGPDAIYLPFDQGSVSHLLAKLSKAPIRAGVPNPAVKAKKTLTVEFPGNPVKPVAKTEWEAAQRFAKLIAIDAPSLLEPSIPPRPDLTHLTGRIVPAPERVLIHPGASHEIKRWPHDRFVELANQLSESHDVWFYIDGKRDPRLSKQVQRVPPLALRDFVAVMARCAYFVGNNSGPMNIAAALGIPSLNFSGPSPTQWDPFWGRDVTTNLRDQKLACQPCEGVDSRVTKCANIEAPHACMKVWSVEEIAMRVAGELGFQSLKQSAALSQ